MAFVGLPETVFRALDPIYDKRIHVKVYCSLCGKLLKHEAIDPVSYKNFAKIEVEPCSECLQGAYDNGMFFGSG